LQTKQGFTLTELLIALGILGVIAAFTIPKVLPKGQGSSHKAVVKEAVAMMQGAYAAYQLNNSVSGDFRIAYITQHLNYVRVDTSSSFDGLNGRTGSHTCGSTAPCLRLHNGGLIHYWSTAADTPTQRNYLGGTTNQHYVYFIVDPDGKLTSPSNIEGPGRAMAFGLYYNGNVRPLVNCVVGDVTGESGSIISYCPGDPPSTIPSWFSWD
jgi:prepilin-type N-terminal cleavage/methylation domain-containing protein